jgi:hypothetical protein
MSTLRRIAPALVLLVLSPLVAEFLLGDFSIRQFGLIVVLLPQYGGGALLVRETARRAGKGWPSIILLALAYALIEEGFTTQSLFNPNYAGQRLLDYGWIPALGTSLDWAVFVLTLHIVWSVASCIAIVEGLDGSRWATPWLGRLGLAVTVVLFLLGCTFTTAFTLKTFPFVASPWRFAGVAIAVVASIVTALKFFDGSGTRVHGSVPPVWLTGAASLGLCSGFVLLYERGRHNGLHPAVTLAGMLALELMAIAFITVWSKRTGWGRRHVLAAATGAILTYGWLSISRMIAGATALGVPTTTVDVVGQIFLLLGILALIGMAGRQSPATRPAPAAENR